MWDLQTMMADERRNDLLCEAERLRRGAELHSMERARYRDGRRIVGRALIRAGHAISSDAR